MENNEINKERWVHNFESDLLEKFSVIKKLPNYNQLNSTFIVLSSKNDAEPTVKELIDNSEPWIILEQNRGVKNSHSIFFGGSTKVRVLYAHSQEEFDWLYDYNSYSSSVIFGKLFKKAGFKYNELGLRYIQYAFSKSHKYEVGEYILTKDLKTILDIFELDHEEFKKGFNTIEEFFAFIIKTPYLKVEKFVDLEKEAKNETLQKLQEYLILNKVQNDNYKSFKQERVIELFPVLVDEIVKLKEKAKNKIEAVNKFNGQAIMETIPGVKPTDIGRIMGEFRDSFDSKEAFKEFITERSKDEIFNKLKEVVTL